MSQIRRHSLKLIWLETFLAVIKNGGFTGAAESLGYDQSTMTRDVQDLELWLGKILFACRSPLQMSDDGEKFIGVAVTVVDLLHSNRSAQQVVRQSTARVRKTKR